jgi:hypothetical protein
MSKMLSQIKEAWMAGRSAWEDRRSRRRTLRERTRRRRQLARFSSTHFDEDAVAARLRLDETARGEALANRPRSDATAPDAAERQVESFVREALDDLKAETDSALTAEFATQQRLLWNCDPRGLTALGDAASTAGRAAIASARDGIREAKEDLGVAIRQKEAFKNEHHLQREAVYPRRFWLHVAAVALVWILESGLNSSLLREASGLGLLGGFLIAVGISTFNVWGSYAVGTRVRAWDVPGPRPAARFLLGAAWLFVLLVYNLGAGHVRSALVTASREAVAAAPAKAAEILNNAGGEAIKALTTDPLGITDPLSWLLVLVGMMFALLAFHAGFTADDSYPRYGTVDRRVKAARAVHDARRRALHVALASIYDRYVTEVDSRLATALKALDQYVISLTEAQWIVGLYCRDSLAMLGLYARLIARYRRINVDVRNTPPPRYFGDPPAPVGIPPLGDAAERIPPDPTSEAEKRAADLQGAAIETKQKLETARRAQLQDMPSLIAELENAA